MLRAIILIETGKQSKNFRRNVTGKWNIDGYQKQSACTGDMISSFAWKKNDMINKNAFPKRDTTD